MRIANLTGFLCAAVLVTLIGCTGNAPYRANLARPGSPGYNPNQAPVLVDVDYTLGFVEFDDQGWFWSGGQRDAVEEMIRQEAGVAPRSPEPTGGIILVTFVHGWKHNAADDDENVGAFQRALAQLAEAEQDDADNAKPVRRPARRVVGVYVAWRGLSATVEPFKELSFWDRKSTAHKVGGYGGLTRLLIDLERIQRDGNAALLRHHPDAPKTELVIIGHSFGGAAVYSAISEILTERFINSLERSRPTRLKPLGDQVILLNPAFEAARHFDLNEMATTLRKYPDNQRPVLSIFTSRTDWATHYAFPVGRFFSSAFESYRPDLRQRDANFQTVGWFEPFLTHCLVYDPDHKKFPATQPTPRVTTLVPDATNKETHQFHTPSQMEQSVENVRQQRGRWQPNAAQPKNYYFDDTVLHPKPTYRPGNPFLVVAVDEQIMNGHNDITNKVLINFLREYILFCQSDLREQQPQ